MKSTDIAQLYEQLLAEQRRIRIDSDEFDSHEARKQFAHFQQHYQDNEFFRNLFNYVAKHPQTNAKSMAEALNCLPGTLSKRLHHLMTHDLITESINSENKREHFYELSERGKRLFEIVNIQLKGRRQRELEIINQFSPDQQTTIYEFLSKMKHTD